MSSSQAHEKGPATLQSTRQMLDDLDALMERMLAIPVNSPDDAADSPPGLVRMPTVSATLTVLDLPAGEQETIPDLSLPREACPPCFEAETAWAEKMPLVLDPRDLEALPKTVPDFGLEPIPAEAIPPPITELTKPAFEPTIDASTVRVPRGSWASRLALPLIWLNQAFDACTLLLGAPGRWLRGPHGRRVLGIVGLLLLVAAGIWLMIDWLGWTW